MSNEIFGYYRLPEDIAILVAKGVVEIWTGSSSKQKSLPTVLKKYVSVLDTIENIEYRDHISAGECTNFEQVSVGELPKFERVEYWVKGHYNETTKIFPVYRIAKRPKNAAFPPTFENLSVTSKYSVPDKKTLDAAWALQSLVESKCAKYDAVLEKERLQRTLEEAQKKAAASIKLAHDHMNGLLQYAEQYFQKTGKYAFLYDAKAYRTEEWDSEFENDHVIAFWVYGTDYCVVFRKKPVDASTKELDDHPFRIDFWVPDELMKYFIGKNGENVKYWSKKTGISYIKINPQSQKERAVATA